MYKIQYPVDPSVKWYTYRGRPTDLITQDYGDPTVKFIFGLLNPDRDAVIKVFPGVKAVAKPVGEIVAILVLELVQLT